ncbi:hypothetical protein Mgra_00004796 [Meloidogyne graminicola]|uniref:Uncharacterized protein n=1 Tax=Meloidogyne graminicola TaxID=189291 RepID=A0A8S9ZR43_9BILA|nr:hypothetical protein Mgra_00004796 [Meloidogyne graminicola]
MELNKSLKIFIIWIRGHKDFLWRYKALTQLEMIWHLTFRSLVLSKKLKLNTIGWTDVLVDLHFAEFETVDGCKASLTLQEQTIKGKQCEIKPAKTRELGYMNKKIFVGGN